MSRNPATIAWIVLVLSFFTCCVIAFGAPATANWYLAQAMKVDGAQLDVISGIATLQHKGSTQANATTGSTAVVEGDTIRTTGNSQAVIWLPNGSNVRLWPDTAVTVVELRSTRYNNNNAVMKLRQENGHSRVEVAMLVTRDRSFEIATPEGTVTLREGSYSLDLQPNRSEITTHYGSATVEAGGRSVELLQGERSALVAGEPPGEPVPSASNLVANGDFAKGLDGWQWGNRDEEEPVLGAVVAVTADGLPAVRFLRAGATKHAETFLVQNINRDVTDFSSLKLSFDLKLIEQSLSGGGWLGSEYPLMVKVKYRDVWGSEMIYRRGFYFQNKDRLPTANGEQVEHNVWLKRESYDLFNRAITDPRPAFVVSVELSASGWNYESLVTNVRLIGE